MSELSLSTRLERAESALDKIETELHELIGSLGIEYTDYSFNPYLDSLTLLVEYKPPTEEQMEELKRLGGFRHVQFKWIGGCV